MGGKTALLWRGIRHNVTVRETITLWDEQRALLSSWFTDRLESVYQTTPLFDAQMPSDDDLQPWPGGRPEVVVSVPERALLQLLRDVGKTKTLQDSRNLVERMHNLHLPVLDKLLAHTTRIKVLRLTRFLSEKLGLPWAQVARTHSESMGGGHGDA
ncbi:type IV toxin-antitoxin system AbiEi family antitoxin domain-containing protein [Variovorax sp. J22G73]|uniref:type IV toxin-antitoxin system AbiEi family antitoxin domain-containing protein n=1 Tax=Variovorax sp. J22R203 TaxID=3053512 RepID=UPI00257669E2|nr:type IV toxin-antitoxin system AbiEi family antitoxin domain-containing protein [Variovorax sp. J22R203]MDM0004800.1 type IV toxin-antitoxin system AbiEi family antitoxin domain-containing protein [Variovorax sp. J22R203]MDM0098216.1 type IV toxin-antitoxin system AbiEi family antitoxin domain-containing protein [Variovorax sp. J22G73]